MSWTAPVTQVTGYVVTASDWNVQVNDLLFLYGDSTWTAVATYTNSWAASGTTPGYILQGRTVYLRGAMTAGTAGDAAFTLPAGYRPTQASEFIVSVGSTTVNQVIVNTSGTVVPTNSTTVWLSGISFSVV